MSVHSVYQLLQFCTKFKLSPLKEQNIATRNFSGLKISHKKSFSRPPSWMERKGEEGKGGRIKELKRKEGREKEGKGEETKERVWGREELLQTKSLTRALFADASTNYRSLNLAVAVAASQVLNIPGFSCLAALCRRRARLKATKQPYSDRSNIIARLVSVPGLSVSYRDYAK